VLAANGNEILRGLFECNCSGRCFARRKREPRIDANGRELILKAEVFEVVGCAMEVLNALGHGLLEKPYENALVVEFGIKKDSLSATTAF